MTKRAPSAFFPSLARLAASTPRCVGAAFIDREGEAVEVAGAGDQEFEALVAAAHWRIVLDEARFGGFGSVSALVIGAARRSYLVRALPEGYAIVLVCRARGAFAVSDRAIDSCAYALGLEAGFVFGRSPWRRVEVLPRGPRSVAPQRARYLGDWHEVEILGCVLGLHARDRGYRVRLRNGLEATLVREPLGHWWADEAFE